MSVLLIAEHNNKELRPFTYNAVSAASKIDEDLHILILGNKSEAVAKSASEGIALLLPALVGGRLEVW